MQKVLIVGAGKGGTSILRLVKETELMDIVAVIDINPNAPGIKYAKSLGIVVGESWRDYISDKIDIIIEATGVESVFKEIREKRSKRTVLIPGSVAYFLSTLMEEKESLINELINQSYKHDLIFNSTHDGMIVIDINEDIILFNRSAEKMTGHKSKDVLGKNVSLVIGNTQLPRVLHSREVEKNQELILENGKKIITTRIPIVTETGTLLGAFAVFKDITEAVNLAEELTNVREIQIMLEAIINSSEEAISVVDEKGNGILINPAYTRITGLTKEDIVGKPATADISEGESVHMQVLQTRRPIRGARMKVGPNHRDVIVNVAPVIVDGKLTGSVGVIHDLSEIQSLTQELKRARQIIRTLEAKYSFDDIIGTSEEMKFAIEQAKLGAKTPATVLLRGESGTGKELFAHAIHNGSDRKFNKFIRVNCGAISESLLESELFGYEEGAFSGAKRGGKRGYFEEANNGSIFLDEIGELSSAMQVKLLRVLQENEIIRVGSTKPISINVRIIAATNFNLEKGIANGTFREDLYYRLNRLPIQIPPLRQRKQDIPLLCEYLLHKINRDYGRMIESLTPSAVEYLMSYNWPGNVRELENILGRAVIYMKYSETRIELSHIPKLENDGQTKSESIVTTITDQSLADLVEGYEARVLGEVLRQNKGNKTATAKQLNISLRSLYYKLEKYNIVQE
ncbi:PAS domain S-box-containing protein [Bacillus mesophilus]|uniref:PAS domain S-box protein n=1 Tax=Bacillus mesophilus TaxID=1808955 RepID=A0A6M0Q5K8_9BACI|nr:sigma-54-dependent Fis family transcriptional regulator [Bacillus mesophilus]MBM7660912.1 PAS domain S-box-containing protein [Bacillus mesophilus]NEY71543.1 PAS domain S-box protein [Bacillus mesophilus]